MSDDPTSRTSHDDVSRRFDPLALVAGLIFVGVAVVGLTDRVQLSVGDLRWLAPILLVAFGILLVATAAGGGRPTKEAGQQEGTPGAPDTGHGTERAEDATTTERARGGPAGTER
jgi:hypothetical protein